MKILSVLRVASAAFFFACMPALAQNSGAVTNHAFPIGKGPGVTGFGSLVCTGFAVGTGAGADPICRGIATGDLPLGTSVLNPGTGTLEAVLPIQTVTGASKSFLTADLFKETRRSNSGSAMSDTFPASSATGLVNGTKITVVNVDASASDTITAGAGTTISGTGVVGPGRAIQYVYDLPNTIWRPTLNTGTALLGPNNLSDIANVVTARANLGLSIGTSGANVPLLNGANTWSSQQTGTANGGGSSAAFMASALGPAYAWQGTGQPADQKVWDAIAIGATLQFRAVNDANNVANPWITVTRGAGATVSNVSIPTLTINNPVSGFFFQPDGALVQRFERFLAGGAVVNAASNVLSQPDWLTQFQIGTGRGGGFLQYAQSGILTSNNAASQTALITGAQTLNIVGAGNAIAGIDIGVNNNTSVSTGVFGRYIEVYRMSGVAGGAAGLEIDTVNYAGLVNLDPFQQNAGQTAALQIAAGAELSSAGQFPSSAAINVQYNNATFAKAFNIGSNAINGTNGIDGNVVPAITMATGHAIKYYYGAGNVNWTLSAAIGVNGDYNFTTTGGGAVSAPAVRTPLFFFGSGASSAISATSTNTGFQNAFTVSNSGTVSNSLTFAASSVSLTATSNAYVQMIVAGGVSPTGHLESGLGLTGGLNIAALAGTLSLTSPTLTNATVTGSFTATGLVTNADLANSTISGVSLGSNLNALTFGAHLTSGGSSYNGSAGVTITSDATSANTASTIMARDGSGQVAATTFTGALSGNATTATSATNTAITDDTTTNASMFLTWVTANTGNLPQKVSSTKLSFNPITGALSSTAFVGAGTGLTGTAASLTVGDVANAPVIAKVLTGFASGAGTVSASDSILSAFQKLDGNVALKAPIASPTFTGTATIPTIAATTINAFTLGGTISGGGNNINNVVIGASTPLAGSFTTLTGTGGSHVGMTGLGIRSTGAAFDLTLASTEVFTAGRTLTITLNDAARTLNMGGNITTAGVASLPAIAQGDVWYGSATGVISALAKSASATRYLANTGASNNPAWAQVDLSNGVTGTLPGANGGLGDTGTGWSSYSVTVGCSGGGSPGTSAGTGRQKTVPVGGKSILVQIDLATSGTVSCGNGFTVTLPTTPQSTAIFSAQNKSTGTLFSAFVPSSGVNGVNLINPAVTGQFLSLTGAYESQ